MSDADLSLAAARGDESAKRALLVQHLAGLRAYVRLRLGGIVRAKESSTDVLQSVCREVLEDLPRFEYRDEPSFRHWLFRRAEHKIVDRVRFWNRARRDADLEEDVAGASSASNDRRALADVFTPSRDAAAREELARVEEAFAKLSAESREVILLARVVGLPHARIAEQMGKSEGAVRTLLCRSLARLSTLLQD